MAISTIQFKRILKYSGTSNDAISYIHESLSPALKNGEPLLVSYKEDTSSDYKYFIAIGIDEETRKIRVSPMFDSLDSFVEYIKYYSSGLTAENLADSSDITIELDESNHYIIKLKASIISAENITTTIISEEQEIVLTQNEFNNSVWTKIESIEDNLMWHKL